jgi:hypothetical protein
MMRLNAPTDRRGMPAGTASPEQRRRRSDSDVLQPRKVNLIVRGAWRPRLRAAGIHLAISSIAAAVIMACVFWLWYPGALASVHGVHAMLFMLLVIDLVLGPALTFLVFDRRKKNLPMDLAIIVALQSIAMAYGVHVIQHGRPMYVVLVKDRFEVVAPAEMPGQLSASAPEGVLKTAALLPQWIAVSSPKTIEQRNAILFESAMGGRDLQHHPSLYAPLSSELPDAAARGIPVERIRQLNPSERRKIDAAVADSGFREHELRVLPLRGPAGDAAVLIALPVSQVVNVLPLKPW